MDSVFKITSSGSDYSFSKIGIHKGNMEGVNSFVRRFMRSSNSSEYASLFSIVHRMESMVKLPEQGSEIIDPTMQ